jgi:hypothetical protein
LALMLANLRAAIIQGAKIMVETRR